MLVYLVVCFLYCCDLLLGGWVVLVCYLVYVLGLLRLLGCVCYGYLGWVVGCVLFVVRLWWWFCLEFGCAVLFALVYWWLICVGWLLFVFFGWCCGVWVDTFKLFLYCLD